MIFLEKTRIIFLRHGQSEGNLRGEFIGQGNAPLTEKGHAQAKAAAEYLKNEKIDLFYASDLKRAFDTGKHVADWFGMEIIPEKELREIEAGSWEGKPFEELARENEDFKLWLSDIGASRATDGESVKELYDRVNAFVDTLTEKHKGKTILCATHATPIRAILCKAKGLSAKDMQKIPWTANASVTIIDYFGDEVKILVEGNADFQGELKTALPRGV